MTAHLIFRSAIFLSLFGFGIQSTLAVKNEVNVLDRPASHLNTLFHVGLWVENMEISLLEPLASILISKLRFCNTGFTK